MRGQADKHAITQQLGVQLRDLRLLDPQLHASYPSALLSRDKALVVNLEHIKCIITKDEILIQRVVRCHWDRNFMNAVSNAYKQVYKKDLVKRIEGETRGDYEKLMVACVKP